MMRIMPDKFKAVGGSPVSTIEYLSDGCALVRRADDTEKLMMQMDVPEFLLAEMRIWREKTYGG